MDQIETLALDCVKPVVESPAYNQKKWTFTLSLEVT